MQEGTHGPDHRRNAALDGLTQPPVHSGFVAARSLRLSCPSRNTKQLRQALEEQRINEEFDATRTDYLTRQEAGTIHYVPHEEALHGFLAVQRSW